MALERNRGMGWSDHHLWPLLKRGHYGTFQDFNPKHLDR